MVTTQQQRSNTEFVNQPTISKNLPDLQTTYDRLNAKMDRAIAIYEGFLASI